MLHYLGYGFLLPLGCAVLLCRVMRRKLGWLKSRERKSGKEKIHRLFGRPRRPLSGGFAILLSFSAGLLALDWPPVPLTVFFLALVWLFALIGLIDDLQKIGGRGLSEREKLILQSVAAFSYAALVSSKFGITPVGFGVIRLPFTEQLLDVGYFYPLLGMLVIVAAANAVNLTDGLDGLAAGQTAIAAFFMLGFCLLLQKPLATGVFLSLLGACIGFLLFNYPPARLLMGDMGSLSLGAILGAGAMLLGVELFLPLVGAVFVIITLSVIIQIGTVRGLWRVVRFPRHGSTESFRPFLCTPLHHHFQWLGWSEQSILRLFWTTGGVFGVLAILGFIWGVFWLLGVALLPVLLIYAAFQKLLRGSFFIGLSDDCDPPRLGLFRGLPAQIFGRRLYRVVRHTGLAESTLGPGVAEGLLWRPMTEIEARVALGSLFLEQHLDEEALAEWEEIPVRNLLLRESVALKLARLYYSQDRLLDAIRIWEALPASRLTSMPNLQEIVRAARLRLAELASKSYRQCMTGLERAKAGGHTNAEELSRQISLSLRFNRNLLALLTSFTDAPTSSPAGDPSRRRAERLLQSRIRALERAFEWCRKECRKAFVAVEAASPAAGALSDQIEEWLGFTLAEIKGELVGRYQAEVTATSFRPSAKASRNALARLGLRWSPAGAGPQQVVAKSYLEGRVAFFSACYRRERALLEMLCEYGCPVPAPCGGLAKQDRALLLMEAGGTETLAERLESLDAEGRQQSLLAAVASLATLHRQASLHLPELEAEVRSIDKEALVPQYHLNAFGIALERLFGPPQTEADGAERADILEAYRPVAQVLCGRPETFIHFEFTPQHLLLDDNRLTVFDFEQATIGPAEFDVACLLTSPEADLPLDAVRSLTAIYEERSGLRLDVRALDYASLAKSLTYAGAALNFYNKFGGDYHLQRLGWYLRNCLSMLGRHASLNDLRKLLVPGLEEARRRRKTKRRA